MSRDWLVETGKERLEMGEFLRISFTPFITFIISGISYISLIFHYIPKQTKKSKPARILNSTYAKGIRQTYTVSLLFHTPLMVYT